MPDKYRLGIVFLTDGLREVEGVILKTYGGAAAPSSQATCIIVETDIDAGVVIKEKSGEFVPGWIALSVKSVYEDNILRSLRNICVPMNHQGLGRPSGTTRYGLEGFLA